MASKKITRKIFHRPTQLDDELKNLMLTFHLVPTVEVFNHVILSDPDLYQEPDDTADETDEFYIDLVGEDWKDRKRRIYHVKKRLDAHKTQPAHKSNYMHPRKLVWVYAAFKQFPWLIDDCVRPLYIERAVKYVDNTVFHLIQQIASVSVMNESETNRELMCATFIEFNELMFGASGNRWYIDNMRETVKRGCKTIGCYNYAMEYLGYIQPYYNFGYYNDPKCEVYEGSADAATKLLHEFLEKKRVEPVEPLIPGDGDVDADVAEFIRDI